MFPRTFTLPLLFSPDDGGGDGGDGAGADAGDGGDKGGDDAGKGAEQRPPWEAEEFDAERAWKLIQAKDTDKKKLQDRLTELEADRKKREDAEKTEQQKLEEAKAEAEKKASSATNEAARLRVALKKGLTETQAKRLVGETEEDLEKDADELLESFKSDEGDDGQDPPRRPRERLRPGAAPSADAEPNDPAKLAEAVPRGW